MAKRKCWILSVIILAVIVAVPVFGLKPVLMAIGHRELYKFAMEKNYCGSKTCEDGIAYVTALLQKQFRLPADAVPWCMAANTVYFVDLSFANAVKNKFTEWMYQSCENNNLTLDDADITIGEPHEH